MNDIWLDPKNDPLRKDVILNQINNSPIFHFSQLLISMYRRYVL